MAGDGEGEVKLPTLIPPLPQATEFVESLYVSSALSRKALICNHNEGVVKCLTSVEKTVSGVWGRSEQGLLSLGQTLSLMATGISTTERR